MNPTTADYATPGGGEAHRRTSMELISPMMEGSIPYDPKADGSAWWHTHRSGCS